ncbi:hypothetical protein CW629_16580 [Salmonella enterica]|nr:hypothetical protein CW629_16580 [Salmonella enterica]
MRHKYGALLPDGGVSTLSGLQNCAIHRPDKRSTFRHYTLDYILLIYFNKLSLQESFAYLHVFPYYML